MATANQKAMDAMFEWMNAIVTGNAKGGPADNENTPLGGNVSPGNNNGTTKQTKKKCPHCGKHVFHKSADCYKLEANASKQWMGWKSVKETGEATKWQGRGTSYNNKSLVADKLENTSATQHKNYWSPLACLVKEQEENDDDHLYRSSTILHHRYVKTTSKK